MNKQSPNVSEISINLLSEGKSQRLQAMLKKNRAVHIESTSVTPEPGNLSRSEQALLAEVKRVIDDHLAQVLEKFPPSKRDSLFKIRFGMSRAEMYQLPLKQMVARLKIQESRLPDFKRIADLDYNGRSTVD